ncbi:MAG: DNA/RNA nuclease SfsA [Robiginitomaculum sp.]|nr:DNA/RNA nuclease SfsA [Robiginitomaculum sp.]
MKFASPLIEGRLVSRYKRFFADIELADGSIVTAHCANTGSMAGLKDAGNRVWIEPADNPKRKLKYDWRIIEIGQGAEKALVGVHTAWPNKIVEEALNNQHIPELAGYGSLRREVKYGENSRIDFLLESAGRRPCYIEVKSITFSRTQGLAEFPDSPSVRATKHVGELTNMVTSGARAVMLYVVQRDDCDRFSIAADVDPKYQAAITTAHKAGVESLCYACTLSPEEITISHKITTLGAIKIAHK